MRLAQLLILGLGLMAGSAWAGSDPFPADSLPFVGRVDVGPLPSCVTCPPPAICPDRPIPFLIAGALPNSCFQFRGLELIASPVTTPLPVPPIVRAYIARNDCLGMPCLDQSMRWQSREMLPALPAGDYHLKVEIAEVSWCDTSRTPITIHSGWEAFTVAERCSVSSSSCYLYDWGPVASNAACDARVAPGLPARVLFRMNTGTTLAGLQGRLTLDPSALAISRIRAVGLAAHMQVAWHPTPAGAQFVLFSAEGRTFGSPCIPPAACPPNADPVLEVTVSPRSGAAIPPLTKLDVADLLAVDSLGHQVSACPTFAAVPPARICAARDCDFNRDGHLDVRDLVLMTRCVIGTGPCPDSGSSVFDCDGDGMLGVNDVLCCARVILRGSLPDSLPTRSAPGLRVALGSPAPGAASLDLPVRLSGADLVGSARLRFTLPAGVYDRAEVAVEGDAASWLTVNELSSDEFTLALVALAPASTSSGDLALRIRLVAAAGQSPSTDVLLLSAEFAAPDGAVLAPGSLGTPTPSGARRLTLSAARPNPFGSETRFVVSVPVASEAEVGVYDLAGRLVSMLHRGPLTPGEHAFRWNGVRADGTRASDGLYFYRVQGMGESETRRLVLIQSR